MKYAKITPAQMAGLLARMFKVKVSDKPFEVARLIDEYDTFNLPFRMEDCQFCDTRFPVVSGVTTANKDFLSHIADFRDDASSKFVITSDYCRTGQSSLFVVAVGTRDEVREQLDRLQAHMNRIDSIRLVVHGERPHLAAAAVQLSSLLH